MPIDTPLWPDIVDGLLVGHLATPVGPGGPTCGGSEDGGGKLGVRYREVLPRYPPGTHGQNEFGMIGC